MGRPLHWLVYRDLGGCGHAAMWSSCCTVWEISYCTPPLNIYHWKCWSVRITSLHLQALGWICSHGYTLPKACYSTQAHLAAIMC